MSAPAAPLLELLAPVLVRVAAADPARRAGPEAAVELERLLELEFPAAGSHARAIRHEIARGVTEGWLCDRGEPSARFCRVAKPSPATSGLSVDVVSLLGRAIEHTHPLGEVTLGFVADPTLPDDAARFDGRPPGWVFYPPGSTHAPEVTGTRMHLVYFLPEGSVIWQPPP